MPAKRIIPCLDVKNGRVVKGTHFKNLRDAGDPVESAARYDAQGADEVCYLDIAATQENRGTLIDLVSRTAERVFAPLVVGGGVRNEEDFVALLHAGAHKVSVNSAAVRDPDLVDRLSAIAGAQALVVAVDLKRVETAFLGCAGSGTYSNVISGVNWGITNHVHPAVANMSLGGGASTSLDTAVNNLIAHCVAVTVAAGSSATNACNSSPARVANAVTVDSTDANDNRASFSDYGTCIDLFAPGVSIMTTWLNIGSNTLSGNSFAAPHVAGVISATLQNYPSWCSAQLVTDLKYWCTPGVVKNPGTGSPNCLLYHPY